ncbi:MAG TPA: glycosyltransferase, partial [Telluria sp.]|nr:glycosyltransferase [Telluria sp.]
DLQACQTSSMQRGIGRYSRALAQAMARNSGGHELRIVLNSDMADGALAVRAAFDGLLPQSQILTFDAPVPVAAHDERNLWRTRAAERIREHYLAGLQPDVVHVASLFEGWTDNAVTSIEHGDGRFDTAVTLYDLIPLMRKDQYLADPHMAAWYHRKLQSLKNAELLLAISAHSRQEAIDALGLAPASVVNISSAVDDMFRPMPLDPAQRQALHARFGLARPFIMYTGGFDYRKNVEGLVEAYAMLPGELRARYQLAIVCSIAPEDRTRLERAAAKAGLTPGDVVLTGFVADADLVALYNSTALFVFPSLQEGFGLPALEAMACGAPVIGSDCSSIPEVIGRADALFDPTRPAEIGAAIARVLGQPAFEANLREHGLAQARRFSWDASARRALAAFEQLRERPRATAPALARRPRLAFVSPLPPERSGIADYSAALLPELAKYYDIDVVLAQAEALVPGNFAQRSVDWFDTHSEQFDRIMYHFGNSSFHQHMFDLLERHPGVVVLHDFFLSGVIDHAEPNSRYPNNFCRTLYQAHGYRALCDERDHGRAEATYRYPCNKAVLDQASGVIVHSAHSIELAARWYGQAAASGWHRIPLMRALPGEIDKAAARKALGIGADDFLVCSFGMLSPTKCSEQIAAAWIDSALHADPRCHLVFVGDSAQLFGAALAHRIAAHPRIRITGYANDQVYRSYLAAADAAVQLRARSRGETSAAALDCLAYRLPTIINAHGSAAELPASVCIRLDDDFTQAALSAAMEQLRVQDGLRARLSAAAGAYMLAEHHPARIGALYRDAIEAISGSSPMAAYRRLLAALAAQDGDHTPRDLQQTALCIAANRPRSGQRQLLIDVTGLADAAQMVRSLIDRAPAGLRVEPIHLVKGQFRYARRFTLDLLGRHDVLIEDAVVVADSGDILVSTKPMPKPWAVRGVVSQTLDNLLAS